MISNEQRIGINDLTHAQAARRFRELIYGTGQPDRELALLLSRRALETAEPGAEQRHWKKFAVAVLMGTLRTRTARITSIDGVTDELLADIESAFRTKGETG